MMNDPIRFIDIAIEEAKISLREGNSGFGVVIIKNNVLISKAHDTDKTSKDPTSHAEINAIRLASDKLKGDFSDCMLISTHEPCPMCSTALIWARIKQIAFGFSIENSINQGRKRINLSCNELFNRAGVSIEIFADVKKEECGLLYNNQVRKCIKQLRNVDSAKLSILAQNLRDKRIEWFKKQNIKYIDDPLKAAYQLFLTKLGINSAEAPIVQKQRKKLVIHSNNFCPTLEACNILGLDTREICKQLNEEPTEALLQQLNPSLRFKRNYNSLRPFKPYCEEIILLEDS